MPHNLFYPIIMKKFENFTGLFCALIVALVALPFAQGNFLIEELFYTVFSFIILSAFYLVRYQTRHMKMVLFLCIMTVFSNITAYLTPYFLLDNISLIFNSSFLIYTIILLFKKVFASKVINTNVILGAICIYLLIGFAWGMIYSILEMIIPNSFSIPASTAIFSQVDGLLRDFFYYSFTTLSTAGYGDITPISVFARYCSVMEIISGQLYLSVLIARLVGMHISQHMKE